MDQYSREFIAEKARLRPEDLGLVRTARRSHNQLGLAYQIAFIRLTGRAPGQQPFEILEDLVGYVSCEAKGLAYKFARFWALPSSGSGEAVRIAAAWTSGRSALTLHQPNNSRSQSVNLIATGAAAFRSRA